MDGLILSTAKNRPATKNHPAEHDSTGAFQVGANQFHAINKVSSAPVLFDNSGEELGHYQAPRANTLKAVREGGSNAPWDAVAIFCHGVNSGLASAGLFGADGAKALADAIQPRAKAGVTVILYACNAGSPGGFASMLAANLAGVQARVFGHISARHTYANPDTTVFPGGDMVIARSSPLWKNWNDDIIDQTNDLWARFPFMTQQELEAELAAPEFLLGRWRIGSKPDFWDNVFFADATVVQTGAADYLKYAIFDSGKWTADAHNVTVTWDSGATDTWPLHLSIHGQRVRSTGTGGKTTINLAKRIEAPNVNAVGLFQYSGGNGDSSRVEYA